MKSSQLTWSQAIDEVLKSSPQPLHYTGIAERIISKGLRKDFGATPAATVSARIAADIKHKGETSRYMRVDKGIFVLRSSVSRAVVCSKPLLETSELEELQEPEEIIRAFGMFWRRDAVEWKATPKLLGAQKVGEMEATSVDFNGQFGVYLLYDGREVIYVGRTTDRALGRRLYEHTQDRLATRWDRFSWFGLLPVSEKGALESLPAQYDGAQLIPALEAILIEALEPPQNRRRGDDLAAVEFFQRTDPGIEKRKMKAAFVDMIDRP